MPPRLPAASELRFRNIACYVTDSQLLGSNQVSALRESVQQAIEAHVDWIQIREKNLEGRQLLELTRAAVRMAQEHGQAGIRVIVNDRADVAVAAGASGVHLGGNSASAKDVAAWLRSSATTKDFLLGVSCHSLEELEQAEDGGADYVFFGPIFDTPSKRAYGAPLGLATLRDACRASKIPVIAIGGIDLRGVAACLEAGVAGIAAIRLFQDRDATNVREAVEKVHTSR
jgi:thiamine-phosphate pyrophosphorylase